MIDFETKMDNSIYCWLHELKVDRDCKPVGWEVCATCKYGKFHLFKGCHCTLKDWYLRADSYCGGYERK